MWQRGHQVILSYEEGMEVEKHLELWPIIPYWWGNKTTTRALIHYLERMKRVGRPGRHNGSLGGNKGMYSSEKQIGSWVFMALRDIATLCTLCAQDVPTLLSVLPTHGQVQRSSSVLQIHASVYVHA